MEDFSLDELLGIIKTYQEEKGIMFLESYDEIFELGIKTIPIRPIHEAVKDREEATFEIDRIAEMAKKLQCEIVFFSKDTFDIDGKTAFSVEFMIRYVNLLLDIELYSANFGELSDLRNKERETKIDNELNQIRGVLEQVFNSPNFDAKRFVNETFIPYLNESNVEYKTWPVDIDQFFLFWLKETSKIENLESVIDDLVGIANIGEETNTEEDEDNSILTKYYNFRTFSKLETILPLVYSKKEDLKEGKRIKNNLESTSLALHKGVIRLVDSRQVREITEDFLKYRYELGIRSKKCTKEEVESYLRYLSYDILVPKDLLKNAVYEIANSELTKNSFN
ncbi:hypothetical protein ACNF42_07300 [Cuniculiplasma sp. SKW3]|uniref:hypothetical protein n=1 Tax=Cuniculiplasma sp. SKW3 TaxID=3400170 RepID=UPI003FD12883